MDEVLAHNMILIDGYAPPGFIVEVNGVPILSPLNLNNNIPAAPVGDLNVVWQVSGSNISAYVPVSGIGTVTAVFATGLAVATPDPISAAGTINVTGSGNTLVAATAAVGLSVAPSGDVLTADGSGNVKDSGVLLSALALASQLPSTFAPIAGEFLTGYTAATGLFTAATPSYPVTSVFGRTGAVVAVSGDYTAAMVGALATSLMTTAGDMIYENATPTAARLPIGTVGQVLTVAGGLPTWATPAAAPVASVSNSDGTLTISPTTGAVVASLALGHANIWTGTQTFGIITPTTISGNANFTGAPTTPTATVGTNTTQIASTAFVATAAASAGLLKLVSINLTSAQILALNATPILVLAGQGAGTVILPICWQVNVVPGSVAYSGAGTMELIWNNASPVVAAGTQTQVNAGLNEATGTNGLGLAIFTAIINGSGSAGKINQSLYITCTANPSNGNGTATVTVYYILLTGVN
jgi:hypothetical protein